MVPLEDTGDLLGRPELLQKAVDPAPKHAAMAKLAGPACKPPDAPGAHSSPDGVIASRDAGPAHVTLMGTGQVAVALELTRDTAGRAAQGPTDGSGAAPLKTHRHDGTSVFGAQVYVVALHAAPVFTVEQCCTSDLRPPLLSFGEAKESELPPGNPRPAGLSDRRALRSRTGQVGGGTIP